MNNEWNSEVVTEVPESDITVDQSYNASSSNPQSGTAVAGAIEGVNQLPASTSADATKVLTVNSEGVPGWATAASGGVPVRHSLTCYEMSTGEIRGDLPSGEYLEPGLYQVFLSFGMSEYNDAYRHITFGFIVDGSDAIYGRIYYPVSIDSNGPFTTSEATFMRTGYIEVGYPGEVNGFLILFKNGTSRITGSRILNHLSLQYMKVADLP